MIRSKQVISIVFFGILLVFMASCESKSEKEISKNEDTRPNIILILADDMGFSDIGCYGLWQ